MNRLLCLPLVALVAAGCGGRGAVPSPRLTVHFAWPSCGARVIPASSASVAVVVTQGGTTYGTALLVNPATTVTLNNLPLGTVSVAAAAYPNADGSGNVMASATTSAVITDNTTQPVSLTLASTVTHLTVSPNPVNLSLGGLFIKQLVVTAYDASNAVVLSTPTDYAYSTTNSLLFNVSSTGMVTGLVVGTGTVTATHRDSNVSMTDSVHVTL